MADKNWKPLGWQTVPKEPTRAMLDAAYRKMKMDPSCAPFSKRILLKAWDAMLETAPQHPDAVVVYRPLANVEMRNAGDFDVV